MNKKSIAIICTMFIIFAIVMITRMIEVLPWWSFIIPVLALGIVITVRKWPVPGFAIGFLSGFMIWFGANLYFDSSLDGIMLAKIGILLSVPKIVVFLISGVIGGGLTGLALYTGKSIVAYRNSPGLD